MKNSFVLYTEYEDMISELTLEQKGVLLDAIFAHAKGEKVQLEPVLKMAFNFISAQMDRDNEKWEKTRKARQEAGSKGGLAKASKAKQKLAKASKAKQDVANLAVNVNDNVNVNVNVNDINSGREGTHSGNKKNYGDSGRVSLSNRERTKLVYEFGDELTEKAIAYLDSYKVEKGYYPSDDYSDYGAIKSWVINAVKHPDQKKNAFNNYQNHYTSKEIEELEAKFLEN